MAAANEVGSGLSGLAAEVVAEAGVAVAGNETVGAKPALAVDTGVLVTVWDSWGMGEEVAEHAANIRDHSKTTTVDTDFFGRDFLA